MSRPNFTHLHVHTEYSLLDGLAKIKPLIERVKELGMDSIAITDHGTMYGVIEFYKTCLALEVRPIIGCELYVSPTTLADKSPKGRKNFHLTVVAKTEEGYFNLMRLSSIAHLEGFYYKPRIDWPTLVKYHKGLIVLSGCEQGQVAQEVLTSPEKAKTTAEKFHTLFGDNYYLEIQSHPNLPNDKVLQEAIIKLSRELTIPLVATNDIHYVAKEDAVAQDALLALQTQRKVNDPNRLSMLSSPDFYLKSPEEMTTMFAHTPDAITNTQHIAAQCQVKITLGKWFFPAFALPPNEVSNEDYLKKQTWLDATSHYGKLTDTITKRLDYELTIICTKGYAPYFLIMRDFIKWAEDSQVITNTRGSAAGSLVSFVLGITNVDPLTYKLPFERFLNEYRPSPPDIDLDIADNKRQDMITHIANKYGKDRVAQIATFGRIKARAGVRDVARVLDYPYSVGDKIAKLIPMGSQGFPMTIAKALKATPELKKLYDDDPDVQKIINLARQFEGIARHASVHAAGLVISPGEITKFTPLQKETRGENIITQYEMKAAEDVGLIKFDILGIRNLTILGEAIKNIANTQNKKIDIRTIPLDDKKTFAMLSRGETMGTFQLSGGGMTKYIKDLKPTTVEDIMAMVALFRPGPMAVIPEYIKRKSNPKLVTFLDPRMQEYLDKSFGLIVYQDDAILTAIYIAGYTWEEADKFRKAIGKKVPEEMAKQKMAFIAGAVKNGITQKKAEDIFALIEPFAGYGFNKAHAASYGMLAYRTSYIKANFPVEHMCAFMTAESGNSEKISEAVEECRRLSIMVLPPDINKSQTGFSIEKNSDSYGGLAIRFGLSAIKNVGEAAVLNILKERKELPFSSVSNFLERVATRQINKKVLESLIRVGAFDQFGKRSAILAGIDSLRAKATKMHKEGVNGQTSLFGGEPDKQHTVSSKDTWPEMAELPQKELLNLERELLGIYLSENPIKKLIAPFADYITHSLAELKEETFYHPGVIKICGIIKRKKVIMTKKNNQKMAFLLIEDESTQIEVVIFPRLFEKHQLFLAQDDTPPVLVFGKVDRRDNGVSVLADDLFPNTQSLAKKFDFTIEIPHNSSSKALLSLNQLLRNNPGKKMGVIILPGGKNIELSFGVDYSEKLKKSIDALIGPS